jgi:hypothetical protein
VSLDVGALDVVDRLRSQLVVDPAPQAEIQLERVLTELKRRQPTR